MALAVGGGLLLSIYFSIPIGLLILGPPALAFLCYVGIYFPECLIVAALFAPQWKTVWIFRSIDQHMDLTVAMLLCLTGALGWRLLRQFGRSASLDLRTIFYGQFDQLLAYLIFAAIVSASYFYTSAPEYGATKLLRFLMIGTLLLIAPFLLILTEENLRRFARIFVAMSAFTAVQLIVTLETRQRDDNLDITRIGAGWLVGMAILIVVFYPLLRSRRGQLALYVCILPLLIAGLMASAARGPLVSVFFAVLIGMFSWFRRGRLSVVTAAVLLVLFLAGLGVAYFALRQTDAGKYSAKASEFVNLFSQGESSGSAGKRLDYYRATASAIPNHLLFGTGVGSWSTFYFGSDIRNYPHNLFLEIGFEEGLVGLAAFSAFLFFVGLATTRMLRASRSHFLAFALIVEYCVLVSMFSGDLDDNRVLWLWIGITLAICRMVRLRVPNRDLVRREFRNPFPSPATFVGAPAVAGRGPARGRSIPRRDRAWREKFV